MSQCRHCGAYVSPRDETCSYCGAPNPHYQPPEKDVNRLLQQGRDAFRQERYAAAAESYQQAVALDPAIFNGYFYLAASLNALGREREAIDAMRKARQIRPGSAAVAYNLGVMYKAMGRTHEAREHLENALQLAETDPALDDHKRMKQIIKQKLKTLP